ncbi:hypothetical protein M0813_11490 [Anaeramoeba flamelloides]|uniref:Uncharacterized protein n=1 Tax=Anaeramoeba flamelloides TaxID=1746091 RepID=A0AAV7ZFC3_9EUKA|nr:hypothetical protein M0812_15650 [Anaeramoeba flamelloides]KAJ6255276.1 hypothetical protein M0813_11490 [Anaeramoeba flamelloides]
MYIYVGDELLFSRTKEQRFPKCEEIKKMLIDRNIKTQPVIKKKFEETGSTTSSEVESSSSSNSENEKQSKKKYKKRRFQKRHRVVYSD